MSRFTPDSELELLFPALLIPQRVKDELPEDLHVRLPVKSIQYDQYTNYRL